MISSCWLVESKSNCSRDILQSSKYSFCQEMICDRFVGISISLDNDSRLSVFLS